MGFGRLSIEYPRSVCIINTRLAIVHWLITLLFFAGISWPWFHSQGWYSSSVPSGSVAVFPKDWSDEQAAAISNQKYDELLICQHPEKFEYCDSASCEYRYKPTRCKDICAGGKKDDCLKKAERWILEDKGKGLFFPTYVNETVVVVDEHGHKETEQLQAFVKGVEDMGLAFDHGFIVHDLDLEGAAKIHRKANGEMTTKEETVLTVLKNRRGEIVKTIPPSDSMLSLSLKDLMAAGDVSLDTPNYRAGTNWASGEDLWAVDGISPRLSGVEIVVTMSYTNKHSYNWKGYVCELTVRGQQLYSTMDDTTVLDNKGSVRSRSYTGVRISFESTGHFYWVDVTQISAFVATLLVFMGVARQLSQFFATTLLGDISVVYSRIIKERFSMRSTIVSELMKHIEFASSFSSMQNSEGNVTAKDLLIAFRNAFRADEQLSDDEMIRMTHYIFEKMGFSSTDDQSISVSDFSSMCSIKDPLDSKMLTRIFDVDSQTTCMERIFADVSVRDLFAHSGEKFSLKKQIWTFIKKLKSMKSIKTLLKETVQEFNESLFAQKTFEVSAKRKEALRDIGKKSEEKDSDAEIGTKSEKKETCTAKIEQDLHQTPRRTPAISVPNEFPHALPMIDVHPATGAKLKDLINLHGSAHSYAVASLPIAPFVFPGQSGTENKRGSKEVAQMDNVAISWDIEAMSIADKLVAVVDGICEKVAQLEADLATCLQKIDLGLQEINLKKSLAERLNPPKDDFANLMERMENLEETNAHILWHIEHTAANAKLPKFSQSHVAGTIRTVAPRIDSLAM